MPFFANNFFTLGDAAMRINEGMALYVLEEIAGKCDLDQTSVGLLGMAFKADSDDTRASLSYKLRNELMFRAKEVLTTDPYVTTDPDLLPLEEVVERCDVLILCTPHSAYRDLDIKDKCAIDIWGYWKENTAPF